MGLGNRGGVQGSDDVGGDVDPARRALIGSRILTFEHALICIVTVIGFVASAGPISGNTMLLHMRTGHEMFENGSIPRHDPYSFTADGDGWVLQSWLAEWSYGALERLGGWQMVIFEQMLLTGLIAFGVAMLARSGSMWRTALPCVVALAIGIPQWSPRPGLFGVLCFVAVICVVEHRRSFWWLLPIGWIWVNTHGSFPLALAWILASALGSAIDGERARDWLRPLGSMVAGILAGALGPLGPSLLSFPLQTLGERREVFENIVEWSSPNFSSVVSLVQLAAIAASLMILIACRVRWRYAIPVVLFLAASLVSARNLGLLAIVFVPALRDALRLRASSSGETIQSPISRPVAVGVAFVLVLAATGASLRVVADDPLDLDIYPVQALDWMEQEGLLNGTHRIAGQDITGCYRIFRDGERSKVFIDDRYDMYPPEVSLDYLDLLRGTSEPRSILDRHRIDVVLWAKEAPLSHWLDEAAEWQQVYDDDDWLVFSKRI